MVKRKAKTDPSQLMSERTLFRGGGEAGRYHFSGVFRADFSSGGGEEVNIFKNRKVRRTLIVDDP